MSRSCHSATFSIAGITARADHAGEAGEVLGQHRVALVRHRARALLAGREIFLGLEHLGALEVADLDRQPLDRAGDHAERGEEHRVAVARDHLGARSARPPGRACSATCSSTAGSMLAKVPTAPRDRAGGDLGARRDQPRAAAGELGIGLRQLEAEGDRLGMDAVAAADRRRVLVLLGAALAARRAAGRGRRAGCRPRARAAPPGVVSSTSELVMPWCMKRASSPTCSATQVEEGDHVVLGHRLDRVDRGDVDRGFGRPPVPQRLAPRSPAPRPARPACRSHAPRSRTRCDSAPPAPRSRSWRGGRSGGPSSNSGWRDARAARRGAAAWQAGGRLQSAIDRDARDAARRVR